MSKSNSKEIDMTVGPIFTKMFSLALPLMFSGILQLLFNAADIVVVGKFAGDICLAAVGSNGALVQLIITLFVGLSVGANVTCARHIGARNDRAVEETVHTSMLLAILSGVVLTIFGIFVAGPILSLMNTPTNVLPLATTYLKIYFLGMPAMMVYNFGAALLRAKGDANRPLIFLTIAGIINVLLNLYFVIVLKINVRGVGWATVISQYVSATLIFICLLKEKGAMKLRIRKLKLYKDKVLTIVKIGVPAGVQGMMFSISNIIIQSSINSFGDIAMAGNSAAANIEGFVYIAMNAFPQAGMAFMSQNVGAGKNNRLNMIALRTIQSTIVIGVIFGGGGYLCGKFLLSIYTNSAETISYGMIRLTLVCLPYVLDGIMDGFSALLRGLGHSIAPMIMTMIGVCAFRVFWISTIFQIPEYHTLQSIYISYPISWIITALAEGICYVVIIKKFFKVETKTNL